MPCSTRKRNTPNMGTIVLKLQYRAEVRRGYACRIRKEYGGGGAYRYRGASRSCDKMKWQSEMGMVCFDSSAGILRSHGSLMSDAGRPRQLLFSMLFRIATRFCHLSPLFFPDSCFHSLVCRCRCGFQQAFPRRRRQRNLALAYDV